MTDRIKHIEAFVAAAKGAIDIDNRTIRFVISSGAVDRDGEVVEPSAIAEAIGAFSSNPVCLACHQHKLDSGLPPVVGSWRTDSFAVVQRQCEMDLAFAGTELAQTYWQLYKDKHMRAVSIGFRILDGAEQVIEGKRVFVITRLELYEISCVAVGANRDALSKLKAVGRWWAEGPEAGKDRAAAMATKEDINRLGEAIFARLETIEDLLIPGSGDDFSVVPGAEKTDPPLTDGQADGQVLDRLATLFKTHGG